jgi:hypothetical protein
LSIPGNLLTTAMAVMPHKDAAAALEAALSMDIPFWPQLPRLSYGEIFSNYAGSIKKFLDNGGVIVWGIVPTNFEPFEAVNIDTLISQLENIWAVLDKKGIDKDYLLSKSLISPATCCLVNPDGEKTVEKAFQLVHQVSRNLRENYSLV